MQTMNVLYIGGMKYVCSNYFNDGSINRVMHTSKEDVKTTSIYETTTDENGKSEDVIFAVADVYVDAFKEIYGDDFSVDKLTYVNDNTISYDGKEISWEYVDELVYNSMTNKF